MIFLRGDGRDHGDIFPKLEDHLRTDGRGENPLPFRFPHRRQAPFKIIRDHAETFTNNPVWRLVPRDVENLSDVTSYPAIPFASLIPHDGHGRYVIFQNKSLSFHDRATLPQFSIPVLVTKPLGRHVVCYANEDIAIPRVWWEYRVGEWDVHAEDTSLMEYFAPRFDNPCVNGTIFGQSLVMTLPDLPLDVECSAPHDIIGNTLTVREMRGYVIVRVRDSFHDWKWEWILSKLP